MQQSIFSSSLILAFSFNSISRAELFATFHLTCQCRHSICHREVIIKVNEEWTYLWSKHSANHSLASRSAAVFIGLRYRVVYNSKPPQQTIGQLLKDPCDLEKFRIERKQHINSSVTFPILIWYIGVYQLSLEYFKQTNFHLTTSTYHS